MGKSGKANSEASTVIVDYDKKLAEFGFAPIEIEAVTLVLMRIGGQQMCGHHHPRYIKCYEFSADDAVNEERWQKAMREIGFGPDAILLAEHAIFGDKTGSG